MRGSAATGASPRPSEPPCAPRRSSCCPSTAAAAEHYADIRARHRTKSPDAIHLACAASAGVDLFLTNDAAIARLDVPGIRFIAGLDAPVL